MPSAAKQVIIVHSYHLNFPWVVQYRNGFISAINDVDILEFEMDTKRQPQQKLSSIANDAWRFIKKNNADVVVLADDNALKLLGPRVIAHKIPLVFLGINENPRRYIPMALGASGVLERPLLKRSIAMLKKIDSHYNKVKVLMDDSFTSRAILETSFSNKLSQRILGIDVDTKMLSSKVQWQQEVLLSKSQGYQAIIVAVYATLQDNKGNTPTTNEISTWTSVYTPLPLFSFWSFSVGKGKAIGGLTISGIHQGHEAAKKVNHYLKQGYFKKITTGKRGAFLFSNYELKRWNINLPNAIHSQAQFID